MPNHLGVVHPRLFVWLHPNFYPSLLTIQAATETRTATGAVVLGWVDVEEMVDLPCRIAPKGGEESRTTQQILVPETHICAVPMPLPGITPKCRAIVDGRIYDIVSVAYDGQEWPDKHRRMTRLGLRVIT